MKSLPPGQQLVAPGKWPVVGERQPAPLAGEWTVSMGGLVDPGRSWSLVELLQMPQVVREVDVHCVTRWSRLSMEFRGVRLFELLDRVDLPQAVRFVSFVAHSQRSHSTSLPLDLLKRLDPLLATHAAGKLLTPEHGGPLRVVVPERYFYKSLKWLARIDLLAVDQLGYWESQAGYHNGANPWTEERFLAADLNLREVRELLSARDFQGRDLRGLLAGGMNLAGLKAAGARLRDAHLEGADLRDSCFDGANLSGAHLCGADLRGVTFRPCGDGHIADLEGADFRGADLRGATFLGASLFGAIFGPCEAGRATRVDQTTRVDQASLDTLEATPQQLVYLREATLL